MVYSFFMVMLCCLSVVASEMSPEEKAALAAQRAVERQDAFAATLAAVPGARTTTFGSRQDHLRAVLGGAEVSGMRVFTAGDDAETLALAKRVTDSLSCLTKPQDIFKKGADVASHRLFSWTQRSVDWARVGLEIEKTHFDELLQFFNGYARDKWQRGLAESIESRSILCQPHGDRQLYFANPSPLYDVAVLLLQRFALSGAAAERVPLESVAAAVHSLGLYSSGSSHAFSAFGKLYTLCLAFAGKNTEYNRHLRRQTRKVIKGCIARLATQNSALVEEHMNKQKEIEAERQRMQEECAREKREAEIAGYKTSNETENIMIFGGVTADVACAMTEHVDVRHLTQLLARIEYIPWTQAVAEASIAQAFLWQDFLSRLDGSDSGQLQEIRSQLQALHAAVMRRNRKFRGVSS